MINHSKEIRSSSTSDSYSAIHFIYKPLSIIWSFLNPHARSDDVLISRLIQQQQHGVIVSTMNR